MMATRAVEEMLRLSRQRTKRARSALQLPLPVMVTAVEAVAVVERRNAAAPRRLRFGRRSR